MSQPTAYTPVNDFSNDESSNVAGRSTVDTAALDAEFSALNTTLDQTLVNLALIQRDDGALANGIVALSSLSAAVNALLATAGVTVRGAWVTATAYALKDIVSEGSQTYIAAVAHTSGVFATDLAAVKWIKITASAAADISVLDTAGKFAATDVENALAELADATGVDVADAGNYFSGTTVEAALAEIGVRFGYVYIRDQKAANIGGGTSVVASWNTRVLNTEVADTHNNAVVASNQITLTAGTYRVFASAPAFLSQGHRLRLRNVTAGTTLLAGTPGFTQTTDTVQTHVFLRGLITVAAGQVLELQHWFTAALAGTGMGTPASDGAEVEVYAEIEFFRIS